ncbi:hypothetical protein K227x_46180 [Rubripirellula lacrimiformis]|uniref:Uncharacterized protein n=1 Tax=Rubripirellula lacrimiformis TaxID=1930273 RepID=A0A517NGF8_9BACT|nr:hypothetical protein [Rubripirellula lacrimiformis]QDT06210.1 hypothetical protein K227x_46180 [Rubripirellula lacrimiformis]
MRNLTLGVLIVTGGTLAALPFRRPSVDPAPSTEWGDATGPTESALDASLRSDIAASGSGDIELPLPGSLPVWGREPRPKPAPRRVDVPLSFDDLMVPIDQPDPIRQRFAATAEVRAADLERQRVAAIEMPSLDAVAPAMQDELRRRLTQQSVQPQSASPFTPISPSTPFPATSYQASSHPAMPHPTMDGTPQPPRSPAPVSGSLASAPWVAPTPERLPPPTDPAGPRHWIRQP